MASPTVVNVRDHGAAGDGVAQDCAAIAAALAAVPVGGGVLYFPAGQYRCSSPNAVVYAPTNGRTLGLTVRGDGVSATVLVQDGIGSGIYLGDTEAAGVRIEALSIRGNDTGRSGIILNSAKDSVIRDFTISGFLSDAIRLAGVYGINTRISGGRITAGNGASPSGRGVTATGNGMHADHVYFNLGGGRYYAAYDARGCGGCSSSHNLYDGSIVGIQTSSSFESRNDWFDVTNQAGLRLTYALEIHANNAVSIVSPNGIDQSHLNLVLSLPVQYVHMIGFAVPPSYTRAQLQAQPAADGVRAYCRDCVPGTTPCQAGGGGVSAERRNGAWAC